MKKRGSNLQSAALIAERQKNNLSREKDGTTKSSAVSADKRGPFLSAPAIQRVYFAKSALRNHDRLAQDKLPFWGLAANLL